MIPSQNMKFVQITWPTAIVDDGSFTTAEIDTSNFDYLTIVASVGATDAAMVALKVTESDTTGSGHTDVPGCVCGTSANSTGSTSTLPGATSDNTMVVFDINLKNRKRFIDVTATAGDGEAGTFMTILGILSRGDVTPTTAAERGAAQVLSAA